ncbi:MAG TPA: hypothetical protein VNT81_12940 [Vicinamibacterales bacterium]|nr:hypothetical protein [Vicinamibacterales bacterium]
MAKTRKMKKPAARKAVRKAAPKKTVKKSPKKSVKKAASRRPASDALLLPIKGATAREIGTVRLEVVSAGAARVKRMIYPPGFRWSTAMKPVVGTDRCMHAHVGFLAKGEIHIEYADGCVVEYKAPEVVAIDPGHDGWVVGREPVVLIEFDFEGETISKLGMPTEHRH